MTTMTPFELIAFHCNATNKKDGEDFLRIASEHSFDISLLDHIAQVQANTKNYEGSITTLKKMLQMTADKNATDSIRFNMASLLNKTNNPNEALEQLSHIDENIHTKMETALSHYFMGNYEKSRTIIENALLNKTLPPEIQDRLEYNVSIYTMEDGNFKDGYKQYVEKGHKVNIWPTQRLNMIPQWNGEIIPGKTIIIHGEGGIGDEIIGVRFMKHLKDRGMRPVWKTNNENLVPVFNRNGYECVYSYEEIDMFDAVQVMAMYLPIFLNLDKDDIWYGNYLEPDPKYVGKWSKILPSGKKIGIRWQGNTSYEQDLHRSIPSELFKKMEYDGVKINLQLEDELKNDWSFSPNINNIEDTLAIMSLCDIIVTSCTSVAHMAGSIGINTIVCPPIAYYYTWAEGIKWYGDHVTICKQTSHKNWEAVFRKMKDDQLL